MRNLIIDTDFQMDVDDVGALALAHALADEGRVTIRAIALNTPSRWGAPAIDIVNRSYARPMPIGVLPGLDESVAEPEYARALVERFGEDLEVTVQDAVELYRRTLAGAAAGEITIVSIGFFDNLVALLDSGSDDISPLSGRELVRTAVGATLVMGGVYPQGREFNFVGNVRLTERFLDEWPGTVDFVGFEAANGLLTGGGLVLQNGLSDPVAFAYHQYNGHDNGRSSWDPLTLLVAGEPERFSWGPRGRVTIDQDGVNRFADMSDGPHRVLEPPANPELVAADIDRRLLRKRLPLGVEYRDPS
jgi:inosine-uridine nucleoside N-ribohydrolase